MLERETDYSGRQDPNGGKRRDIEQENILEGMILIGRES